MPLEMCRICSGTNQLKNVLGDCHLLELLQICANITITASDQLPKHLCQQCELGLEFSYNLRRQGEETEKRLRQALELDSQRAPNEESPIEVVDLGLKHDIDAIETVKDDEEEFQSLKSETYVDDSIIKLEVHTAQPYEVTDTCDYVGEMNDLIEESVEEEQPLESICLDSEESNMQSVNQITGTDWEVCNENALNEEEQDTNDFIEEIDGSAEINASIITYTCGTCDLVLHHHYDYRQHIKSHGDKRFNCKECNKWFPSRYRMQAHALCHGSNVKMHKCPHCERSYSLNCNLLRHIRTIHDPRRCFKCSQCEKTFSRADRLQSHMVSHLQERNFKCTLCKHSSKTKHYLSMHMRTHRPKEPKMAPKSSEKEPTSAENAPSKKTYQCVYCGKISNHHFTHKNHLRIHTKERPYKCETCAKEFRTMAAMITHERIHVDVRPYQCEHCLLSFRQQSHLKEHHMIHSGVMPHVCSICNIAFTKKSNMLVHMRVHSGEKPYKCAACEQEFKKLALLRRHAKTVHGNGDLAELAKKRDNLAQLAMIPYSEDSELDVGESQLADVDVAAVVDDKPPTDTLPCPTDLCSDLNDVPFGTDDGTMVFVVDDNAKFNIVKLEKLLARLESTPGVSEEWGSGWTGTNFIVEIEETASASAPNSDYLNSREDVAATATVNGTTVGSGPKIIVRTEEVLIVGLVLMLWVGAIVLFFNRWGKIRMLEPYQPKFQQQHRSSCPLVDIDTIPTHQRSSVSRMSMGLVNNINMPTCQFAAYNPSIYAKGCTLNARPRQNSVFVSPSPNQFLMPRPPRKTRSAMDLHSMVLDEAAEQV